MDRRRGFYWCKVSGQEARILLVQGYWTAGEDSTGARLMDSSRGFYWCKVSGQEERFYCCKVSGQEARIPLVQG